MPERRHCRRMITSVARSFGVMDRIVVSCSAGIDSTVLVHAVGQALRINPRNKFDSEIKSTAVYLNHNLRPKEVKAEALHVEELATQYLSFTTPAVQLKVEKGPGLQERARNARYSALSLLGEQQLKEIEGVARPMCAIATAHNANDNAETKLFQFLKTGRSVGIIPWRRIEQGSLDVYVVRPLLEFTREDIERYAYAFSLKWHEDSSNSTDQYTRNKIRHHLIPWVKENINPGIVKMLNA